MLKIIPFILIISLVEVAATVMLAKSIGALQTYSLFAIPTLFGLLIQWRRRHLMQEAWGEVKENFDMGDTYECRMLRTRPSFIADLYEIFSYWMSIALLLIPGPLTALAGFSLLFPSVRLVLIRKMIKDAKFQRRYLQNWKRQQQT